MLLGHDLRLGKIKAIIKLRPKDVQVKAEIGCKVVSFTLDEKVTFEVC